MKFFSFFFYFNLKEFNISYYLEKCFFPHLVSNYSQSKDTCEKIVKPSSISICVTFLNINFKFEKDINSSSQTIPKLFPPIKLENIRYIVVLLDLLF